MCIAIPMKVLAVEPGQALCLGRGDTRSVRTALVGNVGPGDWLLVFIDSAVQKLSPSRAAEVNAALDLLAAAMGGQAAGGSPLFELPSTMTTHDVMALAGASCESCEERS